MYPFQVLDDFDLAEDYSLLVSVNTSLAEFSSTWIPNRGRILILNLEIENFDR